MEGVVNIKQVKSNKILHAVIGILLFIGIIAILLYIKSTTPRSIAQKAVKDFPQYIECFEANNELINRVNNILESVYVAVPGDYHIYYEPENDTIYVGSNQFLADVQFLDEQEKKDIRLLIEVLNPQDYPMYLSHNSYIIVYASRRAWVEFNKYDRQIDNLTPDIIISSLALDNDWFLIAVANEDHVY